MKPIKTRYTNGIIGAPDGWNVLEHSPCLGLPVTQTRTGPGDSEMRFQSTWKTSWRDRFFILLGRPITLGINSNFHPPVSLQVTFEDGTPAEALEHDVNDEKTPIKAVT
jgi:hypothetical protein